METFSYRTLIGPCEGQFKEKGSRFLAFAYPVASETDIREYLSALKKKYFDASHHCFAWTLGADKKLFRAFDDGEPNHSAGDPILGQIRSKDLTNVLIVVVRYFGGVKLGAGGLISAYKSAANDVLSNAGIVEKEVTGRLEISFNYAAMPEVMRLVKTFELVIQSRNFEQACKLMAAYKLRDREKLFKNLELLKATGSAIHYEVMD